MTPCALRKMAPWSAPCCADCAHPQEAGDVGSGVNAAAMTAAPFVGAAVAAAITYAATKRDRHRVLYAVAGGIFGWVVTGAGIVDIQRGS